jgi:20S proteasome alpha/beta subunit
MRLHKLLARNVFSYIFVLGLDAVLISTISFASASASSIYNKESSISSSSYRNFNFNDGLDIDDDDEGRQYYEGIPWQPSPSNLESIDEASRYEALDPIVFSPTGRLHPIEAAVKASKAITPLSNLVLAMRCRDGLLIISTLPTSPYLETRIDNTSIDDVDEKKVNADTATATSTTGSIKNDNKETTNIDVNVDVDDSLLSSSLFLFDETCLTTTTCPILDIHPCIVAATAGNAVDSKIMRTRLFALGVSAMETQGIVEEDISVDQIVRDLANQLQVVTQDVAAAQKQGLDRMIAVSSIFFKKNQNHYIISSIHSAFRITKCFDAYL